MSSGACRALVASLLTLVATLGLTVPVVAQQENLRTTSVTRYDVDPVGGRITATITLTFRNLGGSALEGATFGPIYLEDSAVPRFSRGSDRAGNFDDLPGPWKAMNIQLPPIAAGERGKVDITYVIDEGGALDDKFPVRLGAGFVFTCLTGQDTDRGELRIDGLTGSFRTTVSGSTMEETTRGLTSGNVIDPVTLFTCVEGTDARQLAERTFLGPANRQITLQAYPESAEWLTPAEINLEPALDRIHRFLDKDIPGEGPVIVRQTPPASIGGYASDHGTPGLVQVDEFAGVPPGDILHEAAHAWFTADAYPERWMREGLAEWTASSIRGQRCEPVGPDSPVIELSDWRVVRPTSPENIEDVIRTQEEAACGIMSAVASEMGDERFMAVIDSLLDGRAKYVGSGEPGSAPTKIVDVREWLDAVDEVGLVPAGVEDLDFAQDLIERYGIASDPLILEERSVARARYHEFLGLAAPMAAPQVVREAMDEWRFRDANLHLDQSVRILEALTSADSLVPSAGLLTIIQEEFEGARSAADLDAVLERASNLLGDAQEIVGPLTELQAAAPEGWLLPTAIQSAISQRRFDDVLAAVDPATAIVDDAIAADAALPEAGLLDGIKERYETTPTTNALGELADEVRATRRQAEATGIELAALESLVGDWRIPTAVTQPVAEGRIEAALEISQDARGVITAARDADAALPEAGIAAAIRPRFEAATSAEEMLALRADAERRRNEAVVVGDALTSLRRTVGDWTLPAIVTEPIAERDFATAAKTAAAAERWVEFAAQADAALPEIEALASIREEFETATTLEQLEQGGQLADDWAQAAARVKTAKEIVEAPRGLMTQIGLFGTDVTPQLDVALDAAKAGDVALATSAAASVIDTIKGGASAGGLRLIGIVFLGIAILGVFGLFFLFRRQSGPPWARETTPPWAKAKSGKPPWAK